MLKITKMTKFLGLAVLMLFAFTLVVPSLGFAQAASGAADSKKEGAGAAGAAGGAGAASGAGAAGGVGAGTIAVAVVGVAAVAAGIAAATGGGGSSGGFVPIHVPTHH